MRFNAMHCIARSDRRSSLRLENLNKLLYYLSTLLRWIQRILVILTFNLFISACSDGANSTISTDINVRTRPTVLYFALHGRLTWAFRNSFLRLFIAFISFEQITNHVYFWETVRESLENTIRNGRFVSKVNPHFLKTRMEDYLSQFFSRSELNQISL